MATPANAPQAEAQTRVQTATVLLLALLLRLLVLAVVVLRFPAGWLFTRGSEMTLLAQSLLAGQGLSSPFALADGSAAPTGPTAFIAPGYPILIAAIFRLFGVETVSSTVVILGLQILLNVLTCWLILRIARTLFSPTTALLAGLLWACSPPLLWLPTIFWDTSLSIALLTGLVALALHLRTRLTATHCLALGVYAGIASLINPALLAAIAAILLWLAFQAPTRVSPLRATLLATLTFVLVFSPWPIRNARVFHAFIPLRTTVGFELWMGNHPGSSGFLEENLFPTYNPQELAAYRSQGELPYTRAKSAAATQYIAAHPATFAALTLRRMVRFWLGTGTRPGSLFFTLHAAFTSLLGLIGLALLVRQKRGSLALLFAGPLLLFPLPYYITHAEFRYRLVIDPLLTILAASAVTALLYAKTSLPRSTGTTSASASDQCS